ncbi:hypothetical protein RclHR1_08170006 [Rhizophagus clarus]|uniref:Eukaryotic cytochrome b561-domain-containing protein n=1 Tax=Rhizophagus clarus TaxID=94130 RepID=A0A2Z6RZH9_9GLOM|nr:hypothetical protein RclHR1_08170006 [Rhizophagus clarus]GES76934.1 eukaryotic cytochrome b561-domain-containing protein [Rhizophagus clarus]
MKDIEKRHIDNNDNNRSFSIRYDKDLWFCISATFGLLIYAGISLYISFISDFKLFVWHPILMSLMVLLSTLGTIVLQKAATRHEKAQNLFYHKITQISNLICFVVGFVIAYYKKSIGGKTHFKTYHAKFGLAAFILYIIQLMAGLTLIYFPSLLGGISRSKKYYKHHRFIGYTNLALILLSATTSTQANWTKTRFNQDWIWVVSFGMILIGIIGRINLNKIKICNINWNFSSIPDLSQYIPVYNQRNQINQPIRDGLLA